MTALHEPLDVRKGPLRAGVAVVFAGAFLGILAAFALLRSQRGTLSLRPEHPHWYRSVPVEVNEVEAQPFSKHTAAEAGRERAVQRLRSYGWVDRERKLIHVPLDLAIEIYLSDQGVTYP